MGMVLGKVDVAEPAYNVVLSAGSKVPYEVRKYGTRFAIETEYAVADETRSPFMALAGYIGVMSDAENEGSSSISMTAPVVLSETDKKSKGTKIAMTAPVVIEPSKTMQFILPADYDSFDKIPKPTNPKVKVKKIEPSVGAVHRFNGVFNEKRCKEKVLDLVKQLQEDGVSDLTEEDAMKSFQYWGYNPPFTIPYLRRNEVWVEISQKQLDILTKGCTTDTN